MNEMTYEREDKKEAEGMSKREMTGERVEHATKFLWKCMLLTPDSNFFKMSTFPVSNFHNLILHFNSLIYFLIVTISFYVYFLEIP